MIYFRYLLAAPAIIGVLALFGLYHWGLRNGMDRPVLKQLWGVAIGLPMGIGNVLFNVLIGTWIFWKLPPMRNADGDQVRLRREREKHRGHRRRGLSRICGDAMTLPDITKRPKETTT